MVESMMRRRPGRRRAGRNCLVIEVAVESDRPEREYRPGEHAKHRHEPKARLEVDEELSAPHTGCLSLYPLSSVAEPRNCDSDPAQAKVKARSNRVGKVRRGTSGRPAVPQQSTQETPNAGRR